MRRFETSEKTAKHVCLASYVIEGEKKELDSLFAIMNNIQEQPHKKPCKWGSTWLGYLVMALGEKTKYCFCRGKWSKLQRSGYTLSMTIEIDWAPAYVVMELLKATFPSFRIFYKAEQPCEDIYEKNDADGKYFPEKEFNGESYHITDEKYCRGMALGITFLMQNDFSFDIPRRKDWA